MKKIIIMLFLILSYLHAVDWNSANHQQHWNNKYKSKQYNKMFINGAKKLDKQKVQNQFGNALKHRKQNSHSALSRLKEMEECEQKAKTAKEKQNCWVTKKQRVFNKQMGSMPNLYQSSYKKQMKQMQEIYQKRMKQYAY